MTRKQALLTALDKFVSAQGDVETAINELGITYAELLVLQSNDPGSLNATIASIRAAGEALPDADSTADNGN